jgi:thioredoxin reductase (NADPH)
MAIPKWAGVALLGFLGLVIGGYLFKSMHAKHCPCPPASFSISHLKGKKNLIDMVIIGSGPSGLSAALYGARLGYNTLIISGNEPGGQLTKTTWVENWPGSKKILGQKIIEGLNNQAKSFGAEYLFDVVTNIDFTTWPYAISTEEGRTIYAQTIVIATGAAPKKLGVEGESEYWGKGVTTCAICDAPFYKGKNVVVLGGGDSAAEEAGQLAAYAGKITILVRKSAMRASHAMQKHLKAIPSLSMMYDVDVQKIIGDGSTVKGVEVKNNKTGKISVVPTEGVFLAIGHEPNTAIFKEQLDLDAKGYIKLHNRSQETSLPGVFAAGDVEDSHYRQAGVAAGHGISAALDASNFLTEIGFNKQIAQELTTKGAYFDDFSYEKVEVPHLTSLNDFKEKITPSSGITVVDFYADYCPSCMQMLPVVDSVAAKLAGQVKFYKVDVNQESAKDLVRFLTIPKVPYLLILKNGERAAVYTTTLSRPELYAAIQAIMQQGEGQEQEGEEEDDEEIY